MVLSLLPRFLSSAGRAESNATPGFFRRGHQLADRVEDDLELPVVSDFHLFETPGQIARRGEDLSQLDEGAHDGIVDLNGARAAKNARQHGDALLCECIRGGAASASPT